MPTDSEIETLFRKNNPNSEHNKPMLLQGKYEVIGRAGKGGMGTVYHARDIYLKRDVAIKEFSPESPSDYNSEIDPKIWQELRAAFVREATILANLRHECLPTVFDFFTENRSNYLVMEFVEGDDLDKWAKELRTNSQWRNIYDGRFPVNKVRQWAEDLLKVLIYLHDREYPIFHRDIKPANLKLRNDKICLLDFGLAKESLKNISAFSASEKTLQGFTKGFAPLEQIYGEKTTAQTDIYGLSATLYYLLTGEIPIDGWTRKDDIKNSKPDPLHNVKISRPEIDNAFAEIVMQGLAVEPHHRLRSAREMLEILRIGKVNENNSKNESVAVTSFDPSLTQLSPPSNTYPIPHPMPHPMPPNPTPVPYNQTPLINSSPNLSKRRAIIFSIVGGGFLSVVVMVAIVWWALQSPLEEKQLLSEQKLYKSSSLENTTDTLPVGTKVLIGSKKEVTGGVSYEIKSPKEGWILCKKGESCFASK